MDWDSPISPTTSICFIAQELMNPGGNRLSVTVDFFID